MKQIKDLLQGATVEWKALGDVGKFIRGKRFVKADMIEKGFPCIHYGEMYTHYNIWAKEAKSFISHDLASKLRVANHGDVIIVGAGETIEDIGKATAWLGNTDIIIHDACFSYKSALNPKYVSYFLRTKCFHEQIKKHISSGKISAINAKGLSKAKIPIPPLEVQAHIVRILDTFTELTAELTAELTIRRKQYEYYREQLLTFDDDDVEWRSIGEVAKIQRGKRLVKSQLEESGSYAVYQNSMTPLGYYHESNAKSDTTFIISAGAAGEIGYSNVDFWAADDVYFLLTPNNIKSKFIYYFLLTQQNKILGQVRRASVPRLSKTVIEKLKIPIPSLEKQAHIVSILDKFDTLTNSITEGLPREIELRQQQYEYYREKLLTFPTEDA